MVECRVFGVSLPSMLVSPPGHVVPLFSYSLQAKTPWNSLSQEFHNDVVVLSKPVANSTQEFSPKILVMFLEN